jgi:DNA-directed RNA polymerase specialized sigma24 family protein
MDGFFPATRHSVIERIRGESDDERRAAFGDLVEGYWKPVYKHLRVTWRLDAEDAQDLTQAFFADAFQKGWLERFEPAKARFRTFVRVCADRFVMNRQQAERRLKRGGAIERMSLDFDGAERELHGALATAPEADVFFYQEFIRALFARAVSAVRAEYGATGRQIHMTLFERYDLDPADGVSYADLAREFDLTVTQVTNHLSQIRRSFRRHALDALRSLCGSEAEFRREARDLFGVDVP